MENEIKKDEIELITMSTLNEEGVMNVKKTACDRLLAHRVEEKMNNKRMEDILNRVYVSYPKLQTKKIKVTIPQSNLKNSFNMRLLFKLYYIKVLLM